MNKPKNCRSYRFCTQRDKYSCVPIAVLNAMKWAGMPVTYNDMFISLRGACHTDKDGTSTRRLIMVLEGIAKHCNWTVERLYKCDAERFERLLSHPHRSAVVCYAYWDHIERDWIHHCSFWPNARQGRFVGVNDMSGNAALVFPRNYVKKIFRSKAVPEVWILTRYE